MTRLRLTSRQQNNLITIAAVLGWGGLTLQLYIILSMRLAEGTPLMPGLINFFSFFTVLTNTLAAVVLTCRVTPFARRLREYLLRPDISTGITANMLLVGIAYSVLLRHLWAPEGWRFVADELLHDVMPLAFLAYWLLTVEKGTLRLCNLFGWMLYPLVYLGYALLRGEVTAVYQYPFLNVPQLGYEQVMINAFGILVGFIVISLVLYGVDHVLGKRRQAL